MINALIVEPESEGVFLAAKVKKYGKLFLQYFH